MIHEKYILKIDSHCLSFLFQGGSKRIHMLACDQPAYAQDHEIFSRNSSIDSACHDFRHTLSQLPFSSSHYLCVEPFRLSIPGDANLAPYAID